jgi:hypothetical protein
VLTLFTLSFYRTGTRTKVGALQDLHNSIVRYIKNNYLDGARQVTKQGLIEWRYKDTCSLTKVNLFYVERVQIYF